MSDQSDPEKTALTRVIVTISRDLAAPTFADSPYTAEIEEDVQVNSVIQLRPGALRATDADLVVSHVWHPSVKHSLCLYIFIF